MLERLRPLADRALAPVARGLSAGRISPDVITWWGTAWAVAAALVCFPRGWLWQGALLVAVATVADLMDGHLARLTNTQSSWGAFLDSTLDRICDGAVLGALALWLIPSRFWVGVAFWALVAGQVTSYARARAESLGHDASGGWVTRADRLAVALLGAFLSGVGVPYALHGALLLLAVLGTVTVGQRMAATARAARGPA